MGGADARSDPESRRRRRQRLDSDPHVAVAIVTAIALLTGGAAVAALVEGYRLVGLSVFIAGVGSLVVVVPWTQRWIGVPAAAPGQSQLINRTSSTKGDSR